MKGPSIGVVLLLIGGTIAPCWALADDSPVGLADLEAYRTALAADPDGSAPLVGFKDLWDRPGEYLGRIVTVEGRVARLFRQAKVGDFPPLVEAWVVSTAGDPFCLVFPQVEGRTVPEIGATVRFSGTFLKRITYHGRDVDRLAPLLVGPKEPASLEPRSRPEGVSWSSSDWTMAIGASLVVGWILVRRHFSKPPSAPRRPVEPPPSFVDGESEVESGDDHETG